MSDIEDRMSTLEREMAALRERLNMESGLRASQDGDVSDIKLSLQGMNHLIQALAITQSQHTTALAQVTSIQTSHTIDLAELKAGQHTIIRLLTQAIGTTDVSDDGPSDQ